ncbi:hypothetical protein N7451_007758 [Penicillium sp. IBT 35674x]|nr:hypothetical protein N7451_007758 [Penicillium sp. IBT 35674x]
MPVSRWKGRIHGTEKPTSELEQNPASSSDLISLQTSLNGSQTTPRDSYTKFKPPIPGKGLRNLRYEDFDRLPQISKEELESRILTTESSVQLKNFERKQKKCEPKAKNGNGRFR